MARAPLFLLFSFSLLALVSADCKSFIGSDGFPLGIKPLSANVSVVHKSAEAANASFKVYIEGDAIGGNLGGCVVRLSLADVQGQGAQLYVAPQTLETGLGWKDAEAFLFSQPVEPYGDVNATIRIQDADNPANYALLPVFVKTTYRPAPTPPPVQPPAATFVIPTATPPAAPTLSASKTLEEIGKEIEEDASKYTVAVLAVFFLGALLWVGLKTLQKD